VAARGTVDDALRWQGVGARQPDPGHASLRALCRGSTRRIPDDGVFAVPGAFFEDLPN